MKKIFLFLFLLCNLLSVNAGELQRILASDTSTPTPEGCTKVVFVNGTSCAAIPSMVIKDASGETFVLVAKESNGAPYMYFIPNGKYTVVSMSNVKRCNTAKGELKNGDSFDVPSVGYFTLESKFETPVVEYAKSYGPYSMHYEQAIPSGYSKIIVDSSKDYINGVVSLKRLSDGNLYRILGSATYYQQWYYFIPKGDYQVVSVGSDYKTKINGFTAYQGFKVTFLDSGSVAFSK